MYEVGKHSLEKIDWSVQEIRLRVDKNTIKMFIQGLLEFILLCINSRSRINFDIIFIFKF